MQGGFVALRRVEFTGTKHLARALAGRLPSTVPPEQSHICILKHPSIFQCLQLWIYTLLPWLLTFWGLIDILEKLISLFQENCAQKNSAYNIFSLVMPVRIPYLGNELIILGQAFPWGLGLPWVLPKGKEACFYPTESGQKWRVTAEELYKYDLPSLPWCPTVITHQMKLRRKISHSTWLLLSSKLYSKKPASQLWSHVSNRRELYSLHL